MADENTPADEDLVHATLEGREDAFAELVRRHKRRVFGTAARFARDSHQLDDLAQEVFLRAFRHLGKFRGDAPFEHWLARLTVSACYDFLRRERKNRAHTSLPALGWELLAPPPDAGRPAHAARETLSHAMLQLSPDEQLIITLCELEERSI